MSGTALVSRLANVGGMLGREDYHVAKSSRLQVGLITEDEGVMRLRLDPPRAHPARCALDGTKHSVLGCWIWDAIALGENQPVQFLTNEVIIRSDYGYHVRCAQLSPLTQEVPDDRAVGPGQEQLGSAHAARPPGGQDNRPERECMTRLHRS